MVDIFRKDDARSALRGKSVVFLGDSLNRHLYQDTVTLLCSGELTSHEKLNKRGKDIPTYLNDKLVRHGDLIRGRDYKEEREMILPDRDVTLRFYFLTRCWSSHLETYLRKMKDDHGSPDLIVVLSCLWDINRWGSEGIQQYRDNCGKLLRFIKTQLGARTQVMWLTCPPISVDVSSRGLVVEGMKDTHAMRFNVMEANLMVARTTASFGFDVLDLHSMMVHQVHRRQPDGLHWTQTAVRFQVNMILTHFCKSRDLRLPGTPGRLCGNRGKLLRFKGNTSESENENKKNDINQNITNVLK